MTRRHSPVAATVFLIAISGGTQQALIGKTLDWTVGARNQVAIVW